MSDARRRDTPERTDLSDADLEPDKAAAAAADDAGKGSKTAEGTGVAGGGAGNAGPASQHAAPPGGNPTGGSGRGSGAEDRPVLADEEDTGGEAAAGPGKTTTAGADRDGADRDGADQHSADRDTADRDTADRDRAADDTADRDRAADDTAADDTAADHRVTDGATTDEAATVDVAVDEVAADDDVLEGELLDAAAVAGLPELNELEMVLAERDEYLDALRRLQADFDNFRKRVRRQEEESSSYYVASLVERLLPVLDAVELAASHATGQGDATTFNQVAQLLRDTLAREGLEKIDAPGVVFEPTIHDAVAHVPNDAADSDGNGAAGGKDVPDLPMVEEVLRTGYSLKGKVLRPAMVKVRG